MPIYATWNPADKYSEIVLSNGNLTAYRPQSYWATVRATIGKNTGKWYWEVKGNTMQGAGAGIADSIQDLGTYVGGTGHGYNYNSGGNYDPSGSGKPAWAANDIVMIALDCDAHKLWFGKNGTWNDSGNPATGANPAFSGIASSTWFPSVDLYNATITANFGATSLAYSAPSGFIPGVITATYNISGTVIEAGVPVARTVRAYQRDTGALIAETTSSAVDGSYSLTVYANSLHYVVALDDLAVGLTYNAIIADQVTPV